MKVKIRASSLPELFDCPARWAAKHLDGLKTPNTGLAQLGTAVHHGTAVFDQSRIDGSGVTADDAAGAFVDELDRAETMWTEDMPRKRAEKAGLLLTTKYCLDLSPQYNWKAVEIDFQGVEIDMGDGLILELTGHADRIYQKTGFGVSDIKTGKQAVNKDGTVTVDKHIYQLGQYELISMLAQNELHYDITEPAQIIGLQTTGDYKVGIGEVGRPSSILIGNEKQTGLLEMAAGMLKSGIFHGNPKSMMCHEKYCPVFNQCWFRGQQ